MSFCFSSKLCLFKTLVTLYMKNCRNPIVCVDVIASVRVRSECDDVIASVRTKSVCEDVIALVWARSVSVDEIRPA